MASARRRTVVWIAALASLQAMALVAYRAVERRRSPPPAPFETSALPPRELPAMRFERRDGGSVGSAELRGKPVLLHFWATWCPPCVTEMPLLRELGSELERGGVRLLLVSLDSNWEVVDAFFEGATPPEVVRDPEAGHRALDVMVLPDSYLLDAGGRTRLRIAGARDWSAPSALRAIVDAARPAREPGGDRP